jgi:hypothetical protein
MNLLVAPTTAPALRRSERIAAQEANKAAKELAEKANAPSPPRGETADTSRCRALQTLCNHCGYTLGETTCAGGGVIAR